MYIPRHFLETDADALAAFVDEHAFGTLVTVSNGRPFASHVPFLYGPRAQLLHATSGTMRVATATARVLRRSRRYLPAPAARSPRGTRAMRPASIAGDACRANPTERKRSTVPPRQGPLHLSNCRKP